jgi:hypothetical protein
MNGFVNFSSEVGMPDASLTIWQGTDLEHRRVEETAPPRCVPEHKPVRRGRETIDLLEVEEPKPRAGEDTGGVVRGSDRAVVQTHAVV